MLPLFWVTACHAANPPHPIRAVPASTRTKTIPTRSFLRSEPCRLRTWETSKWMVVGVPASRWRADGGGCGALGMGGAALALC